MFSLSHDELGRAGIEILSDWVSIEIVRSSVPGFDDDGERDVLISVISTHLISTVYWRNGVKNLWCNHLLDEEFWK